MDQEQIDRKLRWGFFFSIMWLAGLGSLVAVINGNNALKEINLSNGSLCGMGRAKWCIWIGSVGLAIWAPILVISIFNNI